MGLVTGSSTISLEEDKNLSKQNEYAFQKESLSKFLSDAHALPIESCVFIASTRMPIVAQSISHVYSQLPERHLHTSLLSVLHKAEINLLPLNINVSYSNPDELTQAELRTRRGSISHSVALKTPAPCRKMIPSN